MRLFGRSRHFLVLGPIAAIALAIGVTACSQSEATGDTPRANSVAAQSSHRRPLVPPGDFLVGDQSGQLLVLDGAGDVVRRVPRRIEDYGPQGIALAPDRRHAFVSVYGNPARLYEVDLATGKKRWLANAISPALSPDQTQLAYVSVARRNDIEHRAALTVRELRTGRAVSIPLESEPSVGTPPENVINWSPGGRQIAVYDGRAIRLANLGAGGGSLSEPLGPQFRLAPVFLNEKTLVTLAHCCVGKQQLTSVDLDSGRRQSFATLPAPPESIVRLKPGLLLAVTALGKLTLVSRGHSKAIAEDITAAAASLPID